MTKDDARFEQPHDQYDSMRFKWIRCKPQVTSQQQFFSSWEEYQDYLLVQTGDSKVHDTFEEYDDESEEFVAGPLPGTATLQDQWI